MSIQLEYYRVFLAVAKELSVSRAAHGLNLTQSAVSQTLRKLEEELGASLFIRSSRGVMLTDAGRILMERAAKPLEELEDAGRYFARLRQMEAGSLKIGASDTLCRALLLPHLKTFRADHPAISIQVTNRTSGETVELLRQGRVDIGFVNLPLERGWNPEEFEVRGIMGLHDCFICGDAFKSHFTDPVDLAALSAFPLMMLERLSAGRRYLDRYLAEQDIHLSPEIELGSLDLLVEFARGNLGIAAVTREFIREREPDIHIIRLTREIPPRQVGMLWRRAVPIPLAAEEFAGRIFAE